MRRTDRLFEIIQLLRSASAPLTARGMADELEVSPRTVYRDIATLQAMRIPIAGAAGVGYVMGRGYDLPPLNFSEEELEAISVGLNLLSRTGDTRLQNAAGKVLAKIDLDRTPHDPLRVSDRGIEAPRQVSLDLIRTAIRNEQKLWIEYRDAEDEPSKRVILPVALTYHVEVAVVAAWCELRNDFRHFRVDRIIDCRRQERYFLGRGDQLRRQLDSNASERPAK